MKEKMGKIGAMKSKAEGEKGKTKGKVKQIVSALAQKGKGAKAAPQEAMMSKASGIKKPQMGGMKKPSKPGPY